MHRVLIFLSLIACGEEKEDSGDILTGDIQNGQFLVEAHACTFCHHDSEGAMAPDFFFIMANFPDSFIIDSINYGIDNTSMGAYQNDLTPQEVADILAYLHDMYDITR